MINSRGEYEFVDIDEGIKINGEIMPLREEARKNDLRGEDPAFLMEAQGERHDALWGFSLAKKQMTKEIRGDRLRDVVKGILEDVNLGSTQWSASFIRAQLPENDSYDFATTDVAKELGLTFNAWDFQSKVWNFESGGVMKRSHIEALFSDADKLRIPYLYLDSADSSHFYSQIQISHSMDKGQIGLDYQYEPDVTPDALYQYYAWGEEYGDTDAKKLRGAWYEAVVNGGNLSYDLTQTRSKWLRTVTRTLCICKTRVWYRKGGDNDYTQNDESKIYDVFSCPSSQTGSVVTMDTSALVAGAKRFRDHYHFSKRQWPFYGQQSALVQLAHIIPVCEMGDHTRWNAPEPA